MPLWPVTHIEVRRIGCIAQQDKEKRAVLRG